MFGNVNYSTKYPHQDYITEKYDSITKVTLFTFNPKFRYDNEEDTKFLKSDKTNEKLKDYIVKFEIDDRDSIISKRTFITYSNGITQEFDNNQVPDYSSFLNTDLVETALMEREAKKLIAKQKE